jgi:hypothetical protein
VTGFEGAEHLKAIVSDCSVQLVLHGHHHSLDVKLWPWRSQGNCHVLSAGSWGLEPDKLPQNQPNSLRLILLDLDNRQIEARSLVYEPRRRITGELEPGAFVPDSAEPEGYQQPLYLPPGFVVERAVTAKEARTTKPRVPHEYTEWLLTQCGELDLMGLRSG